MKKNKILMVFSLTVFINFELVAQDWTNGGNALMANGTFGTNSNHSVLFRTAATNHSIMTNTGLWHFGSTAVPTAKLQISANSVPAIPQLLLYETENDYARLQFRNTTTTKNFAIAGKTAAIDADAKMNFYYDGIGNIMTVQGDGKVGVGELNPAAKLHVTYNSTAGDAQLLLSESESNDYSRINFKNTSTANWYGIAAKPAAISSDAKFNFFYNGTGNIMTMQGNGNVGIGTINPANKLDVCGTVRSNEIIVSTGWCDYVFDKNYHLRSLEDVETFLSKNKHLPNIPAAAEVEANGLKVGNMSAKMMEKIEELTLYIIEMNKRLKALENENNTLSNQIVNQNK